MSWRHVAKTQQTPNRPKTFQNRMFPGINYVTFSRFNIRKDETIQTCLDLFIAQCATPTLVTIAIRTTAVLLHHPKNVVCFKSPQHLLPLFHSEWYDTFDLRVSVMTMSIDWASKVGSTTISRYPPSKLPKALLPIKVDDPSATLRADWPYLVITFKGSSVNQAFFLNGNWTADKLKLLCISAIGLFSHPFVMASDIISSKMRDVEPNDISDQS